MYHPILDIWWNMGFNILARLLTGADNDKHFGFWGLQRKSFNEGRRGVGHFKRLFGPL